MEIERHADLRLKQIQLEIFLFFSYSIFFGDDHTNSYFKSVNKRKLRDPLPELTLGFKVHQLLKTADERRAGDRLRDKWPVGALLWCKPSVVN